MDRFFNPTFNLTCNIWRFGNALTNPPDVVSVCNLSAGRRVLSLPGGFAGDNADLGAMLLLLPKVTDIQDRKNGIGPDSVECPAGTGRTYQATWVDDVSLGFPSEHRFAQLTWGGITWPVPFPADSPPIHPNRNTGEYKLLIQQGTNPVIPFICDIPVSPEATEQYVAPSGAYYVYINGVMNNGHGSYVHRGDDLPDGPWWGHLLTDVLDFPTQGPFSIFFDDGDGDIIGKIEGMVVGFNPYS